MRAEEEPQVRVVRVPGLLHCKLAGAQRSRDRWEPLELHRQEEGALLYHQEAPGDPWDLVLLSLLVSPEVQPDP